jgi:hypothetical protein
MKKTFPYITTLLVIAFAVTLAAISGCKKDKDNPSAATCRLTKVENTGSDTALVVYDSEGRVTSYGSLNYYLINLTYSGLTASATLTNPDTTMHFMNIFLNADKNIQSMNITRNVGGADYYYTYAFQYDADDHIIGSEQTLKPAGSLNTTYYKDSMVYENGNLVDKYTFYKMDSDPYAPYQHLTMTYGSQENKIGYHAFSSWEEPISILSGWNFFYHMFGKTSKNLPVSTSFYDDTNANLFNLGYTFLLDGNGYPTEENIARTGSYPGTRNRKFAYSCD